MSDVALRSEEEEEEEEYSQTTRVDIFEEKCSSLYNLILDQLNDDLSRECPVDALSIEEMAADVIESAVRITSECPEIEGAVQLRVHTISSAMEQLRLRRTTSDCESNVSRIAPFAEIRSWIHSMEERLTSLEDRYKLVYDSVSITKLLADQQVLQLEIQNEGQAFFSRLDHTAARLEGVSVRRHNCIEGVRKRWHTLYINSLSLQCCIENRKSRLTEEESTDSDPELSAPPSKRLRRGSEYSETEEEDEEYCSSMDRRLTCSSADTPTKGDWEHRDIGYSSGENSIHDSLLTPSPTIPSDQRRIVRAVLPIKSVRQIYEEANSNPLKFSDAQNLSDSLIVNESMSTSKEYDEVLALLEDTESVHSGTNWRELRGRVSPSVKRTNETVDGKQSCDASSEESSSWEYEGVNEHLLSTSLHSHLADDLFSLKRPRGSNGRLNVSMLTSTMSSEMDASFCSTRSENPIRTLRVRGMRKKIRPRRLPRSMSDGEQLGLNTNNYCGLDTPLVHVSPPSTPLAASLSLLRRLDDDIIGDEEGRRRRYESGGEESANYEWDDYHPPSKDENWLPDELTRSINPMDKSSEMLSVDEDFSKELSRKSDVTRLVEESRANLQVVQSHLSTSNIDADVMRTVTLIADTNIRHLQSALQNGKKYEDSSDLETVMDEWRRVVSPLPRLVNQVRRFAHSLRSLSSSSILPSRGIQTREEAVKALAQLESIRTRFERERDQLRTLLSTSSSDVELIGMKGELTALTQGYEEAVDKMSILVENVQRLNDDWEKWSSEQRSMREEMLILERRIKEEEGGKADNQEILSQMELCQERMNSLETMCNYLSSHLASLHNEDDSSLSSLPPPDFSAELLLYSSALDQLKKRVHDHIVVPPVPSAPIVHPKRDETTVVKRRPRRTNSTQTTESADVPMEVDMGMGGRMMESLRSSRLLQLLLILSALCALAAIVSSGVFNTTFGPHIEYVRGPPPV